MVVDVSNILLSMNDVVALIDALETMKIEEEVNTKQEVKA